MLPCNGHKMRAAGGQHSGESYAQPVHVLQGAVEAGTSGAQATVGPGQLTSEQEEASGSDAYLVLWLVSPLGAPQSADAQGEGAVKTVSATLAAFSSGAAGCACTFGMLKATGFSCTVTCITCAYQRASPDVRR
jgi:hypothetical protein